MATIYLPAVHGRDYDLSDEHPTESCECPQCHGLIHQEDIGVTMPKSGLGGPKRQLVKLYCRHCDVTYKREREFNGVAWVPAAEDKPRPMECPQCDGLIPACNVNVVTDTVAGVEQRHVETFCDHCFLCFVFDVELHGGIWQRTGKFRILTRKQMQTNQHRRRADLEHAKRFEQESNLEQADENC